MNAAILENKPALARGEPRTARLYGFVAAVGVILFIIALTGYPSLMDNERRIGAYVLDAVQNGNWMIQKDVTGDVTSKPPLLTWIAALATVCTGSLNRFAIYLPSALAVIGVALLLVAAGKRYFSWQAGFLAALMFLFSSVGERTMVTARYDGVLALPVALAALAAFQAWALGRHWTWFWLAGAVGTLAKGPIALVLAGGGLLAHFWERRTGHPSSLRGSHWVGVLLFLVICGGWFLLAYLDMGDALIQKMLGRELMAHATGTGRSETMFLGFYEPPLTFLTDFAPWSLLACLGFWRVWRHPAPVPETRRFERFLVCWFFFGLLLFSVAAHQRGRLIIPLIPAVALLAGREAAHWLRFWSTPRLIRVAGAVTLLALGFFVLYHHVLLAYSSRIQTTLGLCKMAAQVRATFGEQFPLVHVDTPFTLQFYLNTVRPLASFDRAAELLQGEDPAYVAVCNFDRLRAKFPTNAPPLNEFARYPSNGPPLVRIVSNRPAGSANASARLATVLGPFLVRTENLKLIGTKGHELVLRSLDVPRSASIVNQSKEPQPVRIRLLAAEPTGRDFIVERTLSPSEKWSLTR